MIVYDLKFLVKFPELAKGCLNHHRALSFLKVFCHLALNHIMRKILVNYLQAGECFGMSCVGNHLGQALIFDSFVFLKIHTFHGCLITETNDDIR